LESFGTLFSQHIKEESLGSSLPQKGEKFVAVFSLEERLRVRVGGDHSPIGGVRDCGGVHGYSLGGG